MGKMTRITRLFSISKKFKDQSLFKENIALKISGVIKTKIEPKDFKIKEGAMIFNIHPTIKSTILFKKEEIKSKLKEIGI